jgi:hypothetical protein
MCAQGILVMLDMHRLEDDEDRFQDGDKLQGFLVSRINYYY